MQLLVLVGLVEVMQAVVLVVAERSQQEPTAVQASSAISYPDTYNAPTTLTGTYTASTSGSGSLSFGGSVNSYVSTPTSSNFNLGTGNFTIEFWVYFNATATQGIFGQINSSLSASSESLAFSTNSSGQIIAECASGATQYDITSSALSYINLVSHCLCKKFNYDYFVCKRHICWYC